MTPKKWRIDPWNRSKQKPPVRTILYRPTLRPNLVSPSQSSGGASSTSPSSTRMPSPRAYPSRNCSHSLCRGGDSRSRRTERNGRPLAGGRVRARAPRQSPTRDIVVGDSKSVSHGWPVNTTPSARVDYSPSALNWHHRVVVELGQNTRPLFERRVARGIWGRWVKSRSTSSSTKVTRSRPRKRAGICTTIRLPDQCALPVFFRRAEDRISTSGRSKRGGSTVTLG